MLKNETFSKWSRRPRIGKITRNSLSDARKKLKASQFRYLNELLYTQSGSKSMKMFKSDPESFETYHQGFLDQTKKWPEDPLLIIITALMKISNDNTVVADFGCGEARLAQALPKLKVHSFDFIALNERVIAGDMSRTKLESGSVDIAVFCLSLMGTNLKDYLKEANRVLRTSGTMKIAEVRSRFKETSVEKFIQTLVRYGFELKWKDVSHEYFVFIDFKKVSDTKKKAPEFALDPCFYKKR